MVGPERRVSVCHVELTSRGAAGEIVAGFDSGWRLDFVCDAEGLSRPRGIAQDPLRC